MKWDDDLYIYDDDGDDDDDDDTYDVDQLVGAALPSGAGSCTLHTRLLPI